MIHAIALSLIMGADPAPMFHDAPLKPPQLVDDNGTITTITGVEPLAPGVVCLTPGRAKTIRDELATAPSTNWPLVLGVSGGVAVVVGVVVGVVAYGAGRASVRK